MELIVRAQFKSRGLFIQQIYMTVGGKDQFIVSLAETRP